MEEKIENNRMPVEVYSRVTGYFRPVGQWNPGKREEFEDRNEKCPDDVIKSMEERYPDEINED